mgnify:CR=1 FL=1
MVTKSEPLTPVLVDRRRHLKCMHNEVFLATFFHDKFTTSGTMGGIEFVLEDATVGDEELTMNIQRQFLHKR